MKDCDFFLEFRFKSGVKISIEKYVQCSQEAYDVVVVLAHKKGKTPVNTRLKMKICDVFEEVGRLKVVSEGYL